MDDTKEENLCSGGATGSSRCRCFVRAAALASAAVFPLRNLSRASVPLSDMMIRGMQETRDDFDDRAGYLGLSYCSLNAGNAGDQYSFVEAFSSDLF